MINIKDYYLDLKDLNDEKDASKRKEIHDYYGTMMINYDNKSYDIMTSIFYTLIKAGYLKSIRGDKLEAILHED